MMAGDVRRRRRTDVLMRRITRRVRGSQSALSGPCPKVNSGEESFRRSVYADDERRSPDVEGFELNVIRGLHAVIATN